jgi:hypothetical protein
MENNIEPNAKAVINLSDKFNVLYTIRSGPSCKTKLAFDKLSRETVLIKIASTNANS